MNTAVFLLSKITIGKTSSSITRKSKTFGWEWNLAPFSHRFLQRKQSTQLRSGAVLHPGEQSEHQNEDHTSQRASGRTATDRYNHMLVTASRGSHGLTLSVKEH